MIITILKVTIATIILIAICKYAEERKEKII